MAKPVAQKLGIRSGMRARLIDVPRTLVAELEQPGLERGDDAFDYIHLFVTEQAQLDHALPGLRRQLAGDGMLWVSWPKGRRLGTDLTLHHVIRIGYDHGLVESKTVSVDEDWSAIKFTHPKPGKEYRNRYGRLPG